MSRFFIYEEYGARYETMLQLVAATSKTIPNWWAFERGIEALMNSLLPKQQTAEREKKGLTLEDLLIKVSVRSSLYNSANLWLAYPASLSIPSTTCRASQEHAGDR